VTRPLGRAPAPRVALLLGLAGGCAGGEPAPRAPAASAALPEATAATFESGFRDVEAVGQGLVLPLPDAERWRHDARERQSWVATHAGTSSRLLVRVWQATERVRPDDCERALRAFRPDLPRHAPELEIEARRLTVAGDFSAELETGLERGGRGPLDGHALLFASDGRTCLCLAYSTLAPGQDAARQLAERLALMARSFERVRRLDIAGRVETPRP
jgi:hypothetical protein